MKTLEITVSVTIQVPDTGDKTYDCLAGLDAIKSHLNKYQSYELIRANKKIFGFGSPSTRITKIKRVEVGGIVTIGEVPPPLSIDVPIE